MTAWQRLFPVLISGLTGWACVGLFVLLAGLALVADGSRYATQVNLLLFLPAVLLVLIVQPWATITRQPAGWMLIAFLFWVLGCVWFNPGGAIESVRWSRVSLQIVVLVCFVAAALRKEAWFDRALIAAVIVAMVCAWLSLLHTYGVQGYSMGYRAHRLESSGFAGIAEFGNAILAALYYGAMAILALGLWHRLVGYWRVLWLVGLFGLCAAVFLTYSRGVWVALVLAALSFWALTLPRRIFLWVCTLLALTMLAGIAVAPALLAKVFLNLTHREEIWRYAFDQLDSAWLIGLGPEAPFDACIAVLKRCFNKAHSVYVQVLYEFGLVGLVLLLGFVLSLLHGVRRMRSNPHVRVALPLLLFALVAGVASYSALFTRPGLVWVLFWLPVGMLLGARSVQSTKELV